MTPHDLNRLRHMRDAAQLGITFTEGRTREELATDLMLQFALIRAVEVVGEAASKVTPATQGEVKSIPWPQIISMRNRLIHGYFDVDLAILWETVTQSLPPLLAALDGLLEDTNNAKTS